MGDKMNLTEKDTSNIRKLEFNNSNHLNTNGKIYINKNYIYKLVNNQYFFYEEFERNIDYLIKNDITNTPKVIDKIYKDHTLYGYVMEYIKNSITFKDSINLNIDDKLKVKAIIDIHKALKDLHNRNITLGDIHLDNFLINDDGGYIIDLDYMRFIGDEFKFTTSYDIKPYNSQNKITKSSIYSDIVKTALSSLSLLLKINIECLINTKDNSIHLEDIYNIIIVSTKKPELINYFKNLMDGESIYFDDFLIENGYYKEKTYIKK